MEIIFVGLKLAIPMKKPRTKRLVWSKIRFDKCLFNTKTLETARGLEKTEPEGAVNHYQVQSFTTIFLRHQARAPFT